MQMKYHKLLMVFLDYNLLNLPTNYLNEMNFHQIHLEMRKYCLLLLFQQFQMRFTETQILFGRMCRVSLDLASIMMG